MNKSIKLFIKTIFLLTFASLINCSTTKSTLPTSPEIPGTELIELRLPAHLTTISAGGTFEYSPPDKAVYLVLTIGEAAGQTPLKVSGKSVENVFWGCTTDMGMARNSVATTSIKDYNAATYTFSGGPAAPGALVKSWIVLGYDSNMNLVASSPKWDVTVNGW
ncbi:MAG: hypothetical protein OEV78_06440 [Spirochaetia bacterium]|nr:hypothetical protein [Spirochaetia bacterium]